MSGGPVAPRVDEDADAPADVLANAVWHALTTVHEGFAEGTDGARRYRRDVSVFWAAPDGGDRSWAALGALAGPDDVVVLFRHEVGPVPPGWTVDHGGTGAQLVLTGDLPAVPVPAGCRPLGEEDVEAMLALVALTEPGPFAARTIELGGYVGVFEDGRLVAMAGERMALPGHAEVSAVCTHPDARRRGYGAALTAQVARGIRARGDVPFLHVVAGNDGARRVYEELGFEHRRDVSFAVLRPPHHADGQVPSTAPSRQRRQAR